MSFKHQLTSEFLKKRFQEKISLGKTTGVDGISVEKFKSQLEQEIGIIQSKVDNFSYHFSPLKEKLILKGKYSNPRAISIPTVRDRLLIDALRLYLGDKFQKPLRVNDSSIKAKIQHLKKQIDSQYFDSFLKLDVKNYYPSINHEILLNMIRKEVNDKKALSLLKKLLNRSENGVAQGLSISNILATIYLNEIDREYSSKPGLQYYRFVDDILILCSADQASAIELDLRQKMQDLKLTLHATEIGGKSEIGQLQHDELQYLGFAFKQNTVSVRESSIERLRQRIVKVFSYALDPDHGDGQREDYLDELYRKLNLKITGCIYNDTAYGWLFFFNQMNDLTLLHHLDWFVKKTFKRFQLKYDPTEVKSFVKTYFLMKQLDVKKLDRNSYIPSYHGNSDSTIDDLKPAVAEKNQLFEKYLKDKDITKIHSFSQRETLKSMLIELEEDVFIYS